MNVNIKIAGLLFIFFNSFNMLFAFDYLYFMPEDANKALKHMTQELKTANKEVYIAIYNFTHKDIAKAIKEGAKRGVRYYIVFDEKSNVKNKYSKLGDLSKLTNIYTCTLRGKKGKTKSGDSFYGIMHNKLALIDGQTLIMGSANWSNSAFGRNYETLIITNNELYVSKTYRHLRALIHQCKKF